MFVKKGDLVLEMLEEDPDGFTIRNITIPIPMKK